MGDLQVLPTAEEIDKILDGYAEQSSVEAIAYKTGIAPDRIRSVLSDTRFVREAMQRKAAKFALWSFGKGLDRLAQIVEKGTEAQAVAAFKAITQTLASVSPPTHEPAAPEPPKSLEESMKELGD